MALILPDAGIVLKESLSMKSLRFEREKVRAGSERKRNETDEHRTVTKGLK